MYQNMNNQQGYYYGGTQQYSQQYAQGTCDYSNQSFYTNQANMRVCPGCGNYISQNASICHICGTGRKAPADKYEAKVAQIQMAGNSGQARSRLAVFLLSFIGFGLQYFYLRDYNKFIERAGRWIRAFAYMLSIIGILQGMCLILKAICLHFYDAFYCIFMLKYDAYGNEIKWFPTK